MTRGRKLLYLVCALVFLCILAFVVTRLTAEDETEEADEGYTVLSLDADSITKLTWTYNGEEISFNSTEDGWVYADDSEFPLDESLISEMLSALSDVKAYKTIEDAADLDQYGLEEPSCTVTVTADESIKLYIGDQSAVSDMLYISIGDGNVYLTDSQLADTFGYSLMGMVDAEDIPVMSDLTDFTIDIGGESFTVKYVEPAEDDEDADDDDSEDDEDTDEGTWYCGSTQLDTELAENLASYITGLYWAACTDYSADDSELAQYGLDYPTATVTVNYIEETEVATDMTTDDGDVIYDTVSEEKTFVLEIGGEINSYRYARIAGSDMVYLLSSSTAEAILTASADGLIG